jgi:hypothetical protein
VKASIYVVPTERYVHSIRALFITSA